MSLHDHKLLLLSTEDDSINSYNDYFREMHESYESDFTHV